MSDFGRLVLTSAMLVDCPFTRTDVERKIIELSGCTWSGNLRNKTKYWLDKMTIPAGNKNKCQKYYRPSVKWLESPQFDSLIPKSSSESLHNSTKKIIEKYGSMFAEVHGHDTSCHYLDYLDEIYLSYETGSRCNSGVSISIKQTSLLPEEFQVCVCCLTNDEDYIVLEELGCFENHDQVFDTVSRYLHHLTRINNYRISGE